METPWVLLWFGLSEGISEKFRGECHDCFYGMAVSECGEGVETGLRFYYQPHVEQQAHYEHPLKHAEQGSGYSVEPPEVEGMGHILEKVSHGFHPEESGDEHYYVGYDRVDICRGFACGVGACNQSGEPWGGQSAQNHSEEQPSERPGLQYYSSSESIYNGSHKDNEYYDVECSHRQMVSICFRLVASRDTETI